MNLVIQSVDDKQRKAFFALAKYMNVKVKIETDTGAKIERAMKNAALASKNQVPSRPVEDLLNEL
jgi:hypothetical protein